MKKLVKLVLVGVALRYLMQSETGKELMSQFSGWFGDNGNVGGGLNKPTDGVTDVAAIVGNS